MSFRGTLLLANSLAAAWLAVWYCLLPQPTPVHQQQRVRRHSGYGAAGGSDGIDSASYRADSPSDGAAAGIGSEAGSSEGHRLLPVGAESGAPQQHPGNGGTSDSSSNGSPGKTPRAARMTWRERVQRTGKQYVAAHWAAPSWALESSALPLFCACLLPLQCPYKPGTIL